MADRKSESGASLKVTCTRILFAGALFILIVKFAKPPSATVLFELGVMEAWGRPSLSSSRMVNAREPLTLMPPPSPEMSALWISDNETETDSPVPSCRLSSSALRITVADAALEPVKVTVGVAPSNA